MGDVRVRRTTRTLAATLVGAAALGAAAAGCSSEPASPPQIPSTMPAAVHEDTRITLPVTVGVAVHHPDLAGREEHEVLFTVQQAMRALIQAEYTSDGRDPELSQYWSGAGLKSADAQIGTWVAHRQQPVGVIVLDDTQYRAAVGTGPAQVSFCADWSDVVRGDAKTHIVGTSVQPKTVKPTFEQFDLGRAHDGRWRVDSVTLTPDSSHCGPTVG